MMKAKSKSKRLLLLAAALTAALWRAYQWLPSPPASQAVDAEPRVAAGKVEADPLLESAEQLYQFTIKCRQTAEAIKQSNTITQNEP